MIGLSARRGSVTTVAMGVCWIEASSRASSRGMPLPRPAPATALLRRQEVRHREVALAGIVVEPEHPRPGRQFGELLLDRGEGGAARDADQQAFLACAAAGHFPGVLGLDLDRPVDRLGVQVGRMKPAPMPWIGCGPGWPPEITGLSVGS